MRQVLTRILHAIANTADNLSSKLATNEPDPLLDYEKRGYEPAGIIHYGQFEITIGNTTYHAYGQPGDTYNVWAANEHDNDILLGTYPKHQAMNAIINHAKDQKRP